MPREVFPSLKSIAKLLKIRNRNKIRRELYATQNFRDKNMAAIGSHNNSGFLRKSELIYSFIFFSMYRPFLLMYTNTNLQTFYGEYYAGYSNRCKYIHILRNTCSVQVNNNYRHKIPCSNRCWAIGFGFKK